MPPDESQRLPAGARFRADLRDVLDELLRAGRIDHITYAYGMRVQKIAGASRRWFEARATSAGHIRASESSVKRSVAALRKLGILVRLPGATGPGMSARFGVRIPRELLADLRRDPEIASEHGSGVTRVDESNTGQAEAEHGSPVTRTRVTGGPPVGDEYERGGEGKLEPPRSPSAGGIGEEREAQARASIELILADLPPEPAELRAERSRRLETLARMYLACGTGQPPTRSWLVEAFEDTRHVREAFLERACREARRANARGFVPSAAELRKACAEVEAKARQAKAKRMMAAHSSARGENVSTPTGPNVMRGAV